jgi:hypothetical protein
MSACLCSAGVHIPLHTQLHEAACGITVGGQAVRTGRSAVISRPPVAPSGPRTQPGLRLLEPYRTNLVIAPGFRWTTFDLTSQLPADWQQQIIAAALDAEFRNFPRTPVLSRESADIIYISRGRVHASAVRRNLPWLHRLYRGNFLDLVQAVCGEPVRPALDDRYGIVLNVQRGTEMRFECHVDSNPLTGLLFCTNHPAGAGGEVVFAHDPLAADVSAVERDCSVIRPHAGHLILFDGRRHPHYARALTSESDVRVVAVMNFYTESFPESTRPRELNRHLYGDD